MILLLEILFLEILFCGGAGRLFLLLCTADFCGSGLLCKADLTHFCLFLLRREEEGFFVGGKTSSQEDDEEEEEEEAAKMNDSEVSKQVQQMVHFIKQEAEEKANEISVAAEEEFNIEKLQLVEAEKKKIKQEYERKEKQVDVRKKIEYSTQLNASRLKVLQAQDDLVRKMKDAAEKQLRSVSLDDDDYPSLLEALILQGLLRLNESAVQLRCREHDLDYVKSVVDSAANSYAKKTGVDPPEVFVDEKHFLPGPPKEGHHGSSCAGGVVLATKDGRIVLENTLDARLEVVFKQQLPEIRKRLFPAGGLVGV